MKTKPIGTPPIVLAVSLAIFATCGAPAAYSATIIQAVHSAGTTTEWNDAIWGTPAAAPTGGNDYVTKNGFFASEASGLGSSYTGRVRAYSGGSGSPTFNGGSLTVASDTELMLKTRNATYSANLILDGGTVRWVPDAAVTGDSSTLAGTLNVQSESYLGMKLAARMNAVITSTVTGSGTLHLAASGRIDHKIIFDDGAGTSLNGFGGTFDIGGGDQLVTVDFRQAYTMGLAGITMGLHATVDIFNLGADITVGSFGFGEDSLVAGTYTSAQLNENYGTGSQFTGTGTLTVIPEPPSSFAILLGGMGALLLRRRNV